MGNEPGREGQAISGKMNKSNTHNKANGNNNKVNNKAYAPGAPNPKNRQIPATKNMNNSHYKNAHNHNHNHNHHTPKLKPINSLKELKNEDTSGFNLSSKMTSKDFKFLHMIGKGSFGVVWQVIHIETEKIYALKILKKKDLVARKQVIHTRTERRILANIDHPFLVSLRFAFQTDMKLFMVMDFFNGGELFFHLQNEGKFKESRARFYSSEILLAIECLHSHNICYRDLKPENILLDYDGHIKLTDFGLSKDSISNGMITHTFCGSPEYLAPEMLKQRGYTKKVDWWSFGTILYEMLCGLPPFYDENIQDMYEKILLAPVKYYQCLSNNAIDLISKLLDKDPISRIDVKSIKRHAFYYKSIDWEKCLNKEIEPPFKPPLNSKMDLACVSKEFKYKTFAQINNSMMTPSHKSDSLMMAAGQFPKFTYDENKDKQLQ